MSVGGGHVEDGVAVVVARVVDGGGWEAGEEGLDVGEVAVATAEEEVVDVVRGGYQWWWHDGGGDGGWQADRDTSHYAISAQPRCDPSHAFDHHCIISCRVVWPIVSWDGYMIRRDTGPGCP